jgi:hypothetical protein
MSTLMRWRAPETEAGGWLDDVEGAIDGPDGRERGRESRPVRVARGVSARLAGVSESDAVHGTIGVAMVALLGEPRLAVRAARVLLEDSSERKRELRAGRTGRLGRARRR